MKAVKRIAIDVHHIGSRQTGNETYIQNLVQEIAAIAPDDLEFICFTTRAAVELPSITWPGPVKRIRPQSPFVRIPFSIPLELLRAKAAVAHFQYVAPPICRCPIVLTVHDISYEAFPEYFHPIERKRMQILVPFSMRKAAFILTVSEFSKQSIIETYRVSAERVLVIYNGVSPVFRVLETSSYPF